MWTITPEAHQARDLDLEIEEEDQEDMETDMKEMIEEEEIDMEGIDLWESLDLTISALFAEVPGIGKDNLLQSL